MTNQTLEIFQSPLPSRATRRIARRSKASLRGALVARLPAGKHPRRIEFESKLEQRFLVLALIRGDVYDIWDQPTAVEYRDGSGRRRLHTFDFLVTLRDGRRIAIAVKPEKLVLKRRFREELKAIRSTLNPDFADDVVLVTDRQIDRQKAAIATRFHEFRHDHDVEADAVVAKITSMIGQGASVADVIAKSGLGGRAYRAIVRAIFSGLLLVDDLLSLTFESILTTGEAQ